MRQPLKGMPCTLHTVDETEIALNKYEEMQMLFLLPFKCFLNIPITHSCTEPSIDASNYYKPKNKAGKMFPQKTEKK